MRLGLIAGLAACLAVSACAPYDGGYAGGPALYDPGVVVVQDRGPAFGYGGPGPGPGYGRGYDRGYDRQRRFEQERRFERREDRRDVRQDRREERREDRRESRQESRREEAGQRQLRAVQERDARAQQELYRR